MFLIGLIAFIGGIGAVAFLWDGQNDEVAFIAWVFLGTGLALMVGGIIEYCAKRKRNEWWREND